jgi:hypothetical protein
MGGRSSRYQNECLIHMIVNRAAIAKVTLKKTLQVN